MTLRFYWIIGLVSLAMCVKSHIAELSNPNATPETKILYNFLRENFGKKTIAGVMTLSSLSNISGDQQNEIQWLADKTGKKPAILGLDFMEELEVWKNNPKVVEDAITWYNQNGIPVFCWHWIDPSGEIKQFYSPSSGKEQYTNFDVSKIEDESSAEYQFMINDIDQIARRLKVLQDAQVPIVWRPLHEASGGWFWWGYKGAEPCKTLWRIMYNRMVHYHKLNNLIWVWTSCANDFAPDWYPGDNYVDIIGMDIYDPEKSRKSQIDNFNAMKTFFGTHKIIALSECGSIPDIEDVQKEGAYWSWFMPWYGSFTKNAEHNSVEEWKKIMNSDYVITLDKMPDWKNALLQSY